MSVFYRISYWLGFTPWEHAAAHPPAAKHITVLFDREESERKPPLGKALDLGCGTGYWSVELASRGWRVTGIDIIPKAIRRARERARNTGADAHFVQGDITVLHNAGIGAGFDFFWDFGTMHGLASQQREAAGREITAIATPGATMLTLAWAPGRRWPLPRGASRAGIEAAFPAWTLIGDEAFDATGLPPPLRNVQPRCYRLRRD